MIKIGEDDKTGTMANISQLVNAGFPDSPLQKFVIVSEFVGQTSWFSHLGWLSCRFIGTLWIIKEYHTYVHDNELMNPSFPTTHYFLQQP